MTEDGFGHVLTNPLDPDEVIAPTKNALYRSVDGGRSFARLSRPATDEQLAEMTYDRANPQRLYGLYTSSGASLWVYTIDKAAAGESTPVISPTSAPALSKVAGATEAATQTPIPTATSVATPTPILSPSRTPTPSVPPLAAIEPSVTVTPALGTTTSPEQQSAFGSSIAFVGAGAAVLAVGAVAGRRLWRRSPR